MELLLFIGGQASGKSTFYQQRFRDPHLRINLDMLRTRHREAILLEAGLRMKQPLVVDNTNPTPQDRQRYIAAAKAAGFRVAGYYFAIRLETVLQRNTQREGRQCISKIRGVGDLSVVAAANLGGGVRRIALRAVGRRGAVCRGGRRDGL